MQYRAPCAGEEVARRRQTIPHCLPEGSGGPGTVPGLSEAHTMLIQEAPAQPWPGCSWSRENQRRAHPQGSPGGLTSTAGSRGGQRHHRGQLRQQGSGQGGSPGQARWMVNQREGPECPLCHVHRLPQRGAHSLVPRDPVTQQDWV